MTVPQFLEKYEGQEIAKGTFFEDQKVALTGRVKTLRAAGAKLLFIDLHDDGAKV